MIKYQIRSEGATICWSPANPFRRCECHHTYAYPNTVVLAVVEERKELAKENARFETEVNQLKETNKMQAIGSKSSSMIWSKAKKGLMTFARSWGKLRSAWLLEL